MPEVTKKMSIDLERVLPVEQREAAKFLQERIFPELPENHFFLVGETALALRFGHRQSIDLDFFPFHSKVLMMQRLKSLTKFYGNMIFITERILFQLPGSCIVKSTMSWFCLLYFKTSPQIRKVNSTKSRFTRRKKLFSVLTLSALKIYQELRLSPAATVQK